ncbi:MAG: cell division protein FtsB [Methylothermaceae bacteria B42]|nr:MAG: cell division protein FtsB [Methylothermaceae bacteria B42]HHJ39181.1 cell division protein FtsB [Methylothermaceae bacterium]
MRFKIIVGLLTILVLALQFRLWFGNGGFTEYQDLKRRQQKLEGQIARKIERNDALYAEVRDLKSGLAAIEERARRDLGMIKEGESFFMVVKKP